LGAKDGNREERRGEERMDETLYSFHFISNSIHESTHHTASVVLEHDAARVHHPAIRVTQTVDSEPVGLGPGC